MSENNRVIKELSLSSTDSVSLDYSIFSRPKQKEVTSNNECRSSNKEQYRGK